MIIIAVQQLASINTPCQLPAGVCVSDQIHRLIRCLHGHDVKIPVLQCFQLTHIGHVSNLLKLDECSLRTSTVIFLVGFVIHDSLLVLDKPISTGSKRCIFLLGQTGQITLLKPKAACQNIKNVSVSIEIQGAYRDIQRLICVSVIAPDRHLHFVIGHLLNTGNIKCRSRLTILL